MASFIYAGATLLSAASSYKANRENTKFQERQQQVSARVDKLQARRNKIATYREKLNAEAAQVQASTNVGSGSTGGSGFAGGISSLETQYGANAQYVNRLNGLQSYSNNLENKAGKYQSLGSLFGQVAGVAGDNFGGKSGVNSTMRNMFN